MSNDKIRPLITAIAGLPFRYTGLVLGVVKALSGQSCEAVANSIQSTLVTATDESVALAVDEYFVQILETDYITVPDMVTVVAYAKEKWSNEMGSVTPSTILKTGMKKKVKVFLLKRNVSSQKCVDFIKAQGATLPNVFGLAVAEMCVGSRLPRDRWILGFDKRNNLLSAGALYDRGVPRLRLLSGGGVNHGWDVWNGDWYAGGCFVLLCD